MGTFTVTFSDVDGRVKGVVASKKEEPIEGKNLGLVKLPSDIDPTNSFYQTIALDCIHVPNHSICSIVIGGVLYKWC